MVIFYSILGLIIGAVVGLIVAFVAVIPIWIVVGIFTNSTKAAEHAPDIVAPWLVLLGAVIGFIIPIIWAREQRMAREAQQQAEQERLRQEEIAKVNANKIQQQSYYTQLVTVGTTSLNMFEAMPAHLLSAEELLDQAERDFKEGVFAPFWDSIEKATMRLGSFDECVQTIIINSKKHAELMKAYEARPPHFPIAVESVRGMSAANITSDRIRSIVRKAQSNPHFAMIYEQRRTNQLLVAGFNSLAQAIDGMGQRISSSIDGLGSQIAEMASTLDESLNTLSEHIQTANQELIESVDSLHSTAKKEAADQAERHKRALIMLDNIQKRRR